MLSNKQNRELLEEVRTLRQEISASKGPGGALQTYSDPLQTTATRRASDSRGAAGSRSRRKPRSRHRRKFPIQLNGMLLFNAFANSAAYRAQTRVTIYCLPVPERSGATLRQTLLGTEISGTQTTRGWPSQRVPDDGFLGGYAEPGANWLRSVRPMFRSIGPIEAFRWVRKSRSSPLSTELASRSRNSSARGRRQSLAVVAASPL